MRTQMLRNLGPLVGAPSRAGRGGPIGGLAAQALVASAPTPFSQREYAVFLLSMAAEIEHSLMVQYLYSAWSLGGPQVPAEHRDEVESWRRIMLGVAKEEMGHLVTVQNLLRLIGGPIHLDREDFPWISGFYPYAFNLAPASRATVAKYVIAESPEIWPADVKPEERKTIEALATEDVGKPVGRVGVLYAKLIDMFGDERALKDEDFRPETYAAQASFEDWGRGYSPGARKFAGETAPDVLVLPSAHRGQALFALKTIAEQGEAPEEVIADSEGSHFSRFLGVWRGLDKAKDWSPSLPLPINPTLPGPGAGAAVITNEEAKAWAAMFNLRYRMLLTWLGHALELGGSAPSSFGVGRRGLALNRAFGEMYALKTIAGLLVRRPLADDPNKPAGPPFQMPYTMNLPDNEKDFWRLHLDLAHTSLDQARALPATGDDGKSLRASLQSSDRSIAADIEAILQGSQAP